ncbi:MAG: FAD-dependent oxidoreductase [Nigerium sp.]|nr:FAD-dependent oxidoreductase [Nigerium sp.]
MKPWRPGRDARAVRVDPPAPVVPGQGRPRVVVVGGGIAGLAAATGLAERGVAVTLLEAQPQLGGRVRAWPAGDGERTMSRGFHAFFRQYYNLRALLRRTDPALERLVGVADYPLKLAGGPTDSFARIPRTPPWSILGFVATSPTFRISDLARVDARAALDLLRVDFPGTYSELDGVSAAEVLDRLRFPAQARHLALEVFARSFFADPREFSGESCWRCSTPTSSAVRKACCSTSRTTTTTPRCGHRWDGIWKGSAPTSAPGCGWGQSSPTATASGSSTPRVRSGPTASCSRSTPRRCNRWWRVRTGWATPAGGNGSPG